MHGKQKAQLRARNSVVATFLEETDVEADTIIIDHMINCNAMARKKISATGKNGVIIGGVTTSKDRIEADVISNAKGVKTTLILKTLPDRIVEKSAIVINKRAYDGINARINNMVLSIEDDGHGEYRIIDHEIKRYEVGQFKYDEIKYISSNRARVLLVDDEPIILKTFFGFLNGKYDVAAVNSARDAFAYMKNTIPDLILLDYRIRFNEGLCLSLFTLSIALWLFTETQFNQFMFKNTSFITVTAYEILMLTPVPIALLFSYGGRPKKIKRAAIIAAVIPMGVWIINNTLHLLGIVCLGHTLKFTQAMLFVDVFFIAGIQFADIIHIRSRKNEYRGVFWKVPLVGVSILLPLAIIELLKYMFTINKYPNDGILITIGIMCYILALLVDSRLRVYYANINIKAASEEKTRFLANMSHDLRTPLNAILGFNEMILRESQDDKITSYSSSIQSAGDSMKEIINSILDINSIS